MQETRRVLATIVMAASFIVGGCHHEVEVPPLPEQKISLLGDRFFDVKALSAERILVSDAGHGHGVEGHVVAATDRFAGLPVPG